MQHAISNQNIRLGHFEHSASRNGIGTVLSRFLAWCDGQSRNHFLWVGISLMAGIGAVLPITLASVALLGTNDIAYWIAAVVFNVPILVVTLSAMPTKISLPVLFTAWLANAIIIILNLIQVFAN